MTGINIKYCEEKMELLQEEHGEKTADTKGDTMSVIDIKNPLRMVFVIFLFIFGFLMLVVPLNALLPPVFHDFIPPFLEHTSVLLYLQLHADLIVKLTALAFIIYVLWRLIKG
ncbi:MAG: hypothetical protein ACW99A_02925 [Candidatus Kariarchaeaceae archaeon]